MCDIYIEPCKICGEKYPMHLGDFETDRTEISLVCPKCFSKWQGIFRLFNRCIWRVKDEKYLIVALTRNAWRNRHHNHLNAPHTEMVEEKKRENIP